MYLADIWIAPEDLNRIIWEAGNLTLEVGWTVQDLPLLLDLPRESLLRWHIDDPDAGIPVKLQDWEFLKKLNLLRVSLRLSA